MTAQEKQILNDKQIKGIQTAPQDSWGMSKQVEAEVRSMAKGRLKQDVRVRSQDELGELTRAFNQMSAELAQATRFPPPDDSRYCP